MQIVKPGVIQEAKNVVKTTTILLIIPIAVFGLNTLGLLFGGLMATAVLTAVVFTISIVFALLNFGMKSMVKFRDFVAGYPELLGFKSGICTAGILDLAQTVVLTIIGFSMGGPTMAIATLYLGLNVSALFAVLRVWACFAKPEKMKEFRAEMSFA